MSPQNPNTQPIEPQRVCVLSAGAWGVVLASHLARKGHAVMAFDLPQTVTALQQTQSHPKLPGFRLPESLRLTSDLKEALIAHDPQCIVVTTPSHVLRQVTAQCRALEEAAGYTGTPPWVVCSKAIEESSLMTMTDVIESVRGAEWRNRLAVLSGPSFAAEVALEKPTSVIAAAGNETVGAYVQALFMTERFRVYSHDDMLGAELGGSLKNVIAIAAGVCDGMHLGDNARAALITRGLAEILRLGVAMGARAETFAGLSGMGDLILTCGGTLSRNHQFGEFLARGLTCDEALDKIGMVVEGMRTARSICALADRYGVELPISREVYSVIYEGKSPSMAVRDLMRRDAKPETNSRKPA